MPISYKNKIYTTLGTPTALSGNVVSTTDSAGVPAKDYTVKGKTIVWNQLFDKSKFGFGQTFEGITSVNNGDGSFTLSGTSTGYYQYVLFNPTSLPTDSSHKYLLRGCPPGGQWAKKWGLSGLNTEESTDFGEGVIITGATSISPIMYVWSPAGAVSNLVFKPQLFDLTQMFGSGNEPSIPAEFRAMFPDDYYPYNAGELKTIIPTSIEASGINLLNLVGRKEILSDTVGYRFPTDAYSEIDTYVYYKGVSPNGYLASEKVVEATVLSSSVIVKTADNIGADGYGVGIPLTVVPSTTYYIKYTASASGVVSIGYLNSSKMVIDYSWTISNNQFTTPGDCRYVLLVFRLNTHGTSATFENICVSTVQTNEYQPYHKYRADIPSSKYFPDGMRSAGSAYDEINFLSQKAIKRIGAVDLGTLSWGSNTGTYPTNSFYSIGFTDAKGNTTNIISNGKFYNIYANSGGNIIAITDSDEKYDSSEAFKSAMSGVMLYYELATPVETAITPSLQALSTFKGFTSFLAPNSLTQNGPLSVTYYAEGGANPEKGWLTSYRRKLYMGRSIEWNQLLDKSKYLATQAVNGVTFTNNGDGTITANGTASSTIYYKLDDAISVSVGHKLLIYSGVSGGTWSSYMLYDDSDTTYGFDSYGTGKIYTAQKNLAKIYIFVFKDYTCTNLIFKPQLFDLTQMFGAGNEPATPEEFWSYFDHKLYPYNPGEAQPLFKISRKSQWGSKEVAMPNKGDIITMDGKDYRVLKINDKIAEVFCMYDANNSIAFDTNSDHNNTYAGKNIDTYCNSTFYNGLSAAIKTAIIDKTFTQDSWTRSSVAPTESHYTGIDTNKNSYYLTLANAAYGTSITRHCYCLSVQDVLDYLECTTSMGTSDTMLTDVNIWKMFWNVITSPGDKRIWLRSAYASNSDYAFNVHGSLGRLIPFVTNYEFAARPAFQIDLSKVEWSSGGGNA